MVSWRSSSCDNLVAKNRHVLINFVSYLTHSNIDQTFLGVFNPLLLGNPTTKPLTPGNPVSESEMRVSLGTCEKHRLWNTPPKTNGWNLKIPQTERKKHLQSTNFWVPAVCFQGCIHQQFDNHQHIQTNSTRDTLKYTRM